MIPTEKSKAVTNIADMTVLIYGPPKSGKTTFCAQNPDCLIIDGDNGGSRFLSVYRLDCNDWLSFKKALGEMAELKKDGKLIFRTIVMDTVDRMYLMCRQYVCEQNGIKHESEDKAFGRMWDLVKAEFLKATSFIRNVLGLGLWMTSHSVVKEEKIGGVKRSTTTISLSSSYGLTVTSMSDIILFIDQQDDGSRCLRMQAEETLECGVRGTMAEKAKNFVFKSESEAFQKLSNIIKGDVS